MVIEQNTNYAYKLKHIDSPTFEAVRDLSIEFYRSLPQELQDELFETLNHGVDILDSEPQLTTYMFSYGKMHQAKLDYAFNNLTEDFLLQDEINIIDYGCGQAIGTMCYADFLRNNGYSQRVKTITLIEPSEMCLKRAALHVSFFCPDAEIKTINKMFDDLTEEDIVCDEETSTLHIFSNVLDILDFDIIKFSKLVKSCLDGYNQFVCVGPFFNDFQKDLRMVTIRSLLCKKEYFNKFLEKFELNQEKAWTAQILIFSVGEIVKTKVPITITNEEIENDIEDKCGVYSKDGQKLLKCINSHMGTYTIKKGTKVICKNAFEGCMFSQIIIPDSVVKIEWQAFLACELLQTITIPNSVTSIDYNAFGLCESLQQIDIPDSVSFLGPATFHRCISLQQAKVSNSLTCIDYMTFCECTSLHQVLIPNSATILGDHVFSNCKSLKQIIIPNLVTYIGRGAFSNCTSLEHITLSDSLHSIGSFAFEKCQSLKTIACPNSVKHIYAGAFSECVNLQQIIISDSATEIGDEIYYENVFNNCMSLQQIIIPKGSTEKFRKMLDKELWDKLIEE